MPVEISYLPTTTAPPITLTGLQARFAAAGLPCTIEEDSPDTRCLVFEPHEFTIYVSTTGDQVTLATFECGRNDELTISATVDRVMETIGFSADEEADYR